MEMTGFGGDGRVVSKNGLPFSIPEDGRDGREIVSVGDILGYADTHRKWRVTFVDFDTVKMTPVAG